MKRPVSLMLVLAFIASVFVIQPASAATYTQLGLDVRILNGNTVGAWTKISANPATTALKAGVCVRSSSGANLDFVFKDNLAISTTGTEFVTNDKVFAPGTYTYFPCIKETSGTWFEPGAKKTFTIASTPVPSVFGAPQTENFNTNATSSTVLSTYAGTIEAYQDNNKYKRANLSASNGALAINLATDGTGGAVVFGPPDTRWSRLYGRFTMRVKAENGQDHGAAGMLWMSSENWSDGEMDWPEGSFGGEPHAYHHPTPCDETDGDATPHCGSFVQGDPNVSWADYHDYTYEWTPGKVRYIVDGVLVKEVVPTTQVSLKNYSSPSANVGVSNDPARLMIQTAAGQLGPNVARSGRLLIDSYTIEPYIG